MGSERCLCCDRREAEVPDYAVCAVQAATVRRHNRIHATDAQRLPLAVGRHLLPLQPMECSYTLRSRAAHADDHNTRTRWVSCFLAVSLGRSQPTNVTFLEHEYSPGCRSLAFALWSLRVWRFPFL